MYTIILLTQICLIFPLHLPNRNFSDTPNSIYLIKSINMIIEEKTPPCQSIGKTPMPSLIGDAGSIEKPRLVGSLDESMQQKFLDQYQRKVANIIAVDKSTDVLLNINEAYTARPKDFPAIDESTFNINEPSLIELGKLYLESMQNNKKYFSLQEDNFNATN